MSTMSAAERLKNAVDNALSLVKEKYGPGVWKRVSPRTLRSLHHRAVGLHPSVLASRPDTTGVLPHGAVEMRVSTPHFHPFGPSADRST
jgi:hypothetical protein